MWMVETDVKKNRLHIIIGELHEDDFIKFFMDVDTNSQKLKENFSVICYIRLIKFDSTPSMHMWYQKYQELLFLRKMGKSVHIIDAYTKLMHVELDRHSRKAGFHAKPVYSLEEARKKLDTWKIETIKKSRTTTEPK